MDRLPAAMAAAARVAAMAEEAAADAALDRRMKHCRQGRLHAKLDHSVRRRRREGQEQERGKQAARNARSSRCIMFAEAKAEHATIFAPSTPLLGTTSVAAGGSRWGGLLQAG